MTYESFDDLFAAARRQPSYHAADVAIDFNRGGEPGPWRPRASPGRKLARRIGTSPAYVTKLFGGSANFTIETMVKIADALGMTVTPTLTREPVTDWPEDLAAARPQRHPRGRWRLRPR